MTRRSYLNSFSLVEMMVALAAFAILTLLLASSLSALMGEWTFGQAKNERRNSGQAALDRIARDLRQMSLPAARYNSNSLQFIINPPNLPTTYMLPQAAFWQAPVSTDGASSTSTGNLAVVGYFVQWINGAPCLSRLLVNPSSSLTIPSIRAPPVGSPTTSSPIARLRHRLPGTRGSWRITCWDYGFKPWTARENPFGRQLVRSRVKPSIRVKATPSPIISIRIRETPSWPPNQAPSLPCAVQVAIIVLDSRTAKHLTGSEKPAAGSLTGDFWGDVQTFYNTLPAVIKKGAEIQTITVEIAGGPH